jgi:DNA-binding GntR family transcriptional regulator
MTAIAASVPTSCSAACVRQKLRLEGLKEDYGVSVSTLREILNRLTARACAGGRRRGFRSAGFGRQSEELAELRLLLESHALGVSFANADVEWEGRVVSAHHKLASTDRLLEKGLGELEKWKRYDGEFHQALISNCGSRTLMETHALIFDKYFRYQMVAFSYRGSEPAEQHKALLEAALKRDAAAAVATLKVHVNNCVEHALATKALK